MLTPSGPLCFNSSSHQKWLKAGAWEGDKASSLSWHDLKLRISFPLECLVANVFWQQMAFLLDICYHLSCCSIFDVPKFTLGNILGCCSDRWTKSAKRVLKSGRWPISSRILTIKISRTDHRFFHDLAGSNVTSERCKDQLWKPWMCQYV